MIIYKCKYKTDPVNGITILEAEPIDVKEAIAKIRLAHNNVLTGGVFLSEEDLLKIYKPKQDESNSRIEENGDRVDGGATNPNDGTPTKRTRKQRRVVESEAGEGAKLDGTEIPA